MIEFLLSSFVLIFLAEIADKTQLITLTFSLKYKVSDVLTAIFFGILISNAIAVSVGTLIVEVFPVPIIKLLSFCVFIIIGLWTLLNKKQDKANTDSSKEENTTTSIIRPFYYMTLIFVLSEFGDKTQILTMLVSVNSQDPLIVFVGASLGMFLANVIAIFIGKTVGQKLSLNIIRLVSVLFFLSIGISGILDFFYMPIYLDVLACIIVLGILVILYLKDRKVINDTH
jgi:putative Ca2+/H+ antiporter (TMEM165/GDT1 family)